MATTEARMKQLTGSYADLNKSNMLVGEMAVPSDHVPVVRNGVNGWEDLLTSQSAGDIIELSETMTEQIESFEQLVIDKVGINDSTATLTQAYSGSKTQGLINGVNTNLALKAPQTAIDNLQAQFNNTIVSASDYYTKCLSTDAKALLVVSSGATTGQINLVSVTPKLDNYTPIAGDYVRLVSNGLTAEIDDARNAYDGTIFTSAGDGIRTQFNTLHQILKNGQSANLFNNALVLANTYTDANGNTISIGSISMTGFINIENYSKVKIIMDGSKGAHVYHFWDSDKIFISGFQISEGVNEKDADIPIGAKYVNVAFYNAENSISVYGIDYKMEYIISKIKSESIHYDTFSILGDSYSTFKGFTNPISNKQWYPAGVDGVEGSDNNLTALEETWWYLFANSYKSALQVNNSYSGSPICNDGYETGTTDASNYSFIARMNNVGNSSLLIVEGGTNDDWANVAIGNYIYSNWTDSDLSTFRPACAYMLNYLKQHNLGTQIIFMLNNGLDTTIVESVRTICAYYNVPLLELNNIDKQNNHPSINGMMQIKDQVINFLNNNIS